MSYSLENSIEDCDLDQVYEQYLRVINQSSICRNRFGNVQKFKSNTEAFGVLLETLEAFSEECLNSRCSSPSISVSLSLSNTEEDQIEDLLKTGHLDKAHQLWKTKNFDFLKSLSAGSNFYYLRQILQLSEKNTESEKLLEKNQEIENLVASYETLQQAFESLKQKKSSAIEESTTENYYEDFELRKMNEELLEQIDELEYSKAEIENVLRCKVREFSQEIENFVQISEDKSKKIGELSDLVNEIEEKYQGEIKKMKLDHELGVKRLEDLVQRLQSEKKDLGEDCKGLVQHKKIYDQSLEDFKKHIQTLNSKVSELSVENLEQKTDISEHCQKIESLQESLQLLQSENGFLISENHKIKEEFRTLNEIIEKLKIEIEEKCEEIFDMQEDNKDLIDLNSQQSNTIAQLNFELNSLKKAENLSLSEIINKTQELEICQGVLEKYKQDLAKTKELVKSQEDSYLKLNKLKEEYQSTIFDHDKQKIQLKKLEKELQISQDTINTLSSQLEYLESYQKSCESRLETEYNSLCSYYTLTPRPFDSLNSYITAIFEIFPQKFQEDLQRMDELISELNKELQNKNEISQNKAKEYSAKYKSNEYLREQISYLNTVNSDLEHQRLACQQILTDYLGEECKNDLKGISNLIDRLNLIDKENAALVEIVENQRERIQNLMDLNQNLEEKMKRFESCENKEVDGRNDVEVKNLQVLLREYRKHKQEQEKKIQVLKNNLADACKLRDTLADELSEKCEIIENMTKRSLYRSFN